MRSVLRSTTLALLLFLLPGPQAQVVITEFCADNTTLLMDKDGDYSDWIEIANLSPNPVNLAGWSLSDETGNPRKWTFPSTNLAAGAYLVVFASEKNRTEPTRPLHTNFRLSTSGEYLALIQPDGTTIASEYAPTFGKQFPDVSFGYGLEQTLEPIITSNTTARFLVPLNTNNPPPNWTQTDFDDSLWNQGQNAFGYETNLPDPEEDSYPGKVLASQPAIYWQLNESQGLQAANPGNLGTSATGFNVGGGGIFDASRNHFAGQLDEISLWQRALSSQDIANLLSTNPTNSIDFSPYIQTDLSTHLLGQNSSVCVRIPLTLDNPDEVIRLSLQVMADDGFVAWINGRNIANLNAPSPLLWNSTATRRTPDATAASFREFDASPAIDALQLGTNILPVHGLNICSTNTDFLLQTSLTVSRQGAQTTTPRYFLTPTPGTPNGIGNQDLGPIVTSASHSPAIPTESQAITVSSLVQPAFSSLQSVTLHYRVLFGTEIQVAMSDDGTNGDPAANDGWFTAQIPAQIPAQIAPPGQLIRYYITATDILNHTSRWPLHPDPLDSEAYQGTVVHDPSINSQLPVIHTFIENLSAADSWSGTQCSIFYLGELYDNLHVSLHGQSSSGFPQKSHNLDFTSDHRFRYLPDSPGVKDLKLITNYGDKARVRNALAHEMMAASGSESHFCFQARIQLNGQFLSITDVMEDADNLWLKRLGRDPNGALYKMYNNLGSTAGNEKKCRKWEKSDDLQSLVSNLDESRPLATRTAYAWDNLDLPQNVSYCVALILASSQDHGHKNYFLYRDSENSGEWAPLPWDVDLTWGRNWLDAQGYFTDTLFQNNVLNFYNPSQQAKPANRLYNLIFNQPLFRNMVLRRLRTVMDELLQPPGTPDHLLPIENRVRQMTDLMPPPGVTTSDADLDYTQWPTWGNANRMRDEAARMLTIHLPGRREFLFNQNPTLNGDPIPGSQPALPRVQFGALDITPASGNQAEEFIELVNPNPYAIDISGWHLTDAVRHTFRPGTVIPPQHSLFVSPNVQAFRFRQISPTTNESRFVQGNYSGELNARGETISLLNTANQVVTSLSFAGSPSVAQQFLRISEIMFNPPAAPETTPPPPVIRIPRTPQYRPQPAQPAKYTPHHRHLLHLHQCDITQPRRICRPSQGPQRIHPTLRPHPKNPRPI